MSIKLAVGDTAPDFDLETADGGRVTLADLVGAPAVVWCYPAAGTPGCTTEACGLRDNFAEFTADGVSILGISPDTVADILKFKEHQELPYQLAADPTHATLEAYGAWGTKNMYGKITEGVIRSTFVLDANGIITAVKYRVQVAKHVDFVREALAALRA